MSKGDVYEAPATIECSACVERSWICIADINLRGVPKAGAVPSRPDQGITRNGSDTLRSKRQHSAIGPLYDCIWLDAGAN